MAITHKTKFGEVELDIHPARGFKTAGEIDAAASAYFKHHTQTPRYRVTTELAKQLKLEEPEDKPKRGPKPKIADGKNP